LANFFLGSELALDSASLRAKAGDETRDMLWAKQMKARIIEAPDVCLERAGEDLVDRERSHQSSKREPRGCCGSRKQAYRDKVESNQRPKLEAEPLLVAAPGQCREET